MAAGLALVILIFLARSSCGVPEFYPDLIREEASSCWERTMFSEKNDPFYDWMIRSVAFQRHKDIGTQELIKAYAKLSAWRVADNTTVVYNSPEPHVLGGLFIQNPQNWLLKMVVKWGLSIRVCLLEGESMCLYTAQVVVAEDGSFRLLLAEVPYRSSRGSSTTYLTNWISNAKSAGALGISELKGKGYFHPEFSRLCERKRLIAYIPDVIAYLGRQFEECYCLGQVCIVGRLVSKIEFSKGHCKDVNSYWRVLPSGGLNLHSYSPKLGHFFVLNATFPSNPLQNLSVPIVKEMGKLSACFEYWLDTHTMVPILGRSTTQAVQRTCDSELRPDVIAVHRTSQIWMPLSSVSRDIQKLVRNGDNCPVEEANHRDTKCSSDTILTREQLEELRGITKNFMDAKDVRLHANKEWNSAEFRLNNFLWEYVGLMLALCIVCLLMSMLELKYCIHWPTWQKRFALVKRVPIIIWRCAALLVSIVIWMRWHLVAQPVVMADWDFLDDQVAGQQPQQRFMEVIVGATASFLFCIPMWYQLYLKLRKSTTIRLGVSVPAVYALCSMIIGRELYLNLKSLESGPQVGWVHTYQVQPQRNISFLVTTTSTIVVEPYWIWCLLLHVATTIGCMFVVGGLPKLAGVIDRRNKESFDMVMDPLGALGNVMMNLVDLALIVTLVLRPNKKKTSKKRKKTKNKIASASQP